MPIPGARFRVKQTPKGPVRLAFKGNKVVEAKNLKTGATHTQTEFQKDRRRRAKHRAQIKAVRSYGGDNG
jgi:hypothetical protein